MANKNQVHITLQPKTLAKALANALGTIELEFTDKELAELLADKIWKMTGGFDDPGVDWITNAEGHFLLGGDPDMEVDRRKHVGILVDAMNILQYGMVLKVEQRIKVEK
jgi:hypothetical protein